VAAEDMMRRLRSQRRTCRHDPDQEQAPGRVLSRQMREFSGVLRRSREMANRQGCRLRVAGATLRCEWQRIRRPAPASAVSNPT